MMYYVERANGAIIALYANPQVGRTDQEPLSDQDPEVEAFLNPPAASPRATAMWRARAIAKVTPHGAGTLFDAVETAIDALPDPVMQAAGREAWERGALFDIDGQLVPLLMTALGLSEADILPLVTAAEELPA